MEVQPDPMEGEQTWPTEEELQEAEGSSWHLPVAPPLVGTSAV